MILQKDQEACTHQGGYSNFKGNIWLCWNGLVVFHHDDVIKWKHFPRYWPFVQGIHRSPVNSPHKGQWRGALRFSLFCAWTNGWANNRNARDLRRHRAHHCITVMTTSWMVNRLWSQICSYYLHGKQQCLYLLKRQRITCAGIRRSDDILGFIMGIPIPWRRLLSEERLRVSSKIEVTKVGVRRLVVFLRWTRCDQIEFMIKFCDINVPVSNCFE